MEKLKNHVGIDLIEVKEDKSKRLKLLIDPKDEGSY